MKTIPRTKLLSPPANRIAWLLYLLAWLNSRSQNQSVGWVFYDVRLSGNCRGRQWDNHA